MKQIKVVLLSALAAIALLAAGISGATHNTKESQMKRTAPVGQVYTSEDNVPAAKAPAAAAPTGPRTGEQVYTSVCAGCHAAGVAGAPKTGDAAAWTERLAKGEETLVTNAINGINAMPPKGLCMDCSDDEIAKAVAHMIASVK